VSDLLNCSFGEIEAKLQGKLQQEQSLARYTTWRTGGPAQLLLTPVCVQDIQLVFQSLKDGVPITWLGLGSNSLILDKGIRGLVVVMQGAKLNQLTFSDNHYVKVEAGVACGQFARMCARHSLVGAEFLAGVPGTIGGALRMNAGCYGGEMWDLVDSVELLTAKGQLLAKNADEFEVAYRYVDLQEETFFLSATLHLKPGDKVQSLQEIKQLIAKRNASQPTNLPNCGSVFRNPEGDYSARLIEACGLKGYSVGDAQVSEKHANFIVNNGKASSADILTVINYVHEQVKVKQGVDLIQEVKVLGE
jgi:UDP-N-acetylmuramate dehydrogenase